MTSKLTRERIEQYANDPRMCNINDEIRELASMALAAIDSEPVAYMYRDNLHSDARFSMESKIGNWSSEDINEYEISETPLYRHAQQPVVPDDSDPRDAFEAAFPMPTHVQRCGAGYAVTSYGAWMANDYCVKWDGWSACRAAMLQSGNSPAQNPGWIPVSERLPEVGGRYWCYVEEQNSLGKSHYQWNCSWNGEIWGGAMMYGCVTHWMPLPAAPQEVSHG